LLIPASHFRNLNFSFLFHTLHSSGAPSRAPLTSIIRPEQKKKRNLARLRGEVAPWTGPIREPLYKNTREGRREEYRNRPIVPCAVPSIGPVIIGPSPEQRKINFRQVFDRFTAADPPPRRYFPTPPERAEFDRLISAPDVQDFRITRGLLHGPDNVNQTYQSRQSKGRRSRCRRRRRRSRRRTRQKRRRSRWR
jgi:hypothetical protein